MSDERKVFRVGVDLGQRVDHSAVCVVEELPNKAVVRLIVKFQLGTDYPLIVNSIRDMTKDIDKIGDIWSFAVDATGVGSVPTQMFQEALPDLTIEPFIFTNKNKRELVGKVKIMHSFGRLKFAKRSGDETYNHVLSELMTEMKQLQVRVIKEDVSSPEIEVFKTGAHDDLFTALALAVKDIEFQSEEGGELVGFAEDKTWVRTPLSEEQPQLLFTT